MQRPTSRLVLVLTMLSGSACDELAADGECVPECQTVGSAAPLCVPASGGREAFCAASLTPDPACPASLADRSYATGCAGDVYRTWVYCHRLDNDLDCAEQRANCYEVLPGCLGDGGCALSPEPDPRCAEDFAQCLDDDELLTCKCDNIANGITSCSDMDPRYSCNSGRCGLY